MKNYKEMADAVFRRRDEYAADLKRKKKIALNASLSLCAICLATLGAFGIWKLGVLEPDPTVIGTKPHSITETTDGAMHSLSSNATSEGENFVSSELVSQNQGTTDNSGTEETSGQASTKPLDTTQATDPVEKPTKPTKPIISTKPTLPQKPTIPSVIIPTVPVVTDPAETPDVTSATDGGNSNTDADVPQTNNPPKPPTTVAPTTVAPTWGLQDSTEMVPPSEPAWAHPDEVPEVPPAMPPTDATEPPGAEETVPCTQSPSAQINVSGKVVDQNGNGVKGAVVKVYRGTTVVTSATTNSKGEYSISGIEYSTNLYIKQYSAPSGYTPASNAAYLNSSNEYGSNYVIFVCTKK